MDVVGPLGMEEASFSQGDQNISQDGRIEHACVEDDGKIAARHPDAAWASRVQLLGQTDEILHGLVLVHGATLMEGKDVRKFDAPMLTAAAKRDDALFQLLDNKGPRYIEKVGRFLGRHFFMIRNQRDAVALRSFYQHGYKEI